MSCKDQRTLANTEPRGTRGTGRRQIQDHPGCGQLGKLRNGKVSLTKYIQMFGYALSEHEPSQSHMVLGTLAGHEADTCICLATPSKNQTPPSPIALRIASVKVYFPPQLS